jgi:hypothetical protein
MFNEKSNLVDQKKTTNDDTAYWKICCSNTNHHALKYLIQVSMGASVMIFCMTMIVVAPTNDDKAIYYSLLSGTLGYFLPHPNLSSEN